MLDCGGKLKEKANDRKLNLIIMNDDHELNMIWQYFLIYGNTKRSHISITYYHFFSALFIHIFQHIEFLVNN